MYRQRLSSHFLNHFNVDPYLSGCLDLTKLYVVTKRAARGVITLCYPFSYTKHFPPLPLFTNCQSFTVILLNCIVNTNIEATASINKLPPRLLEMDE